LIEAMGKTLPSAPWGVIETALRLAREPMETLDRAKSLAGDAYILKSVWGPVYVIANPTIVDALATNFNWNIVQTTPVTSESPEPFKQLAGDTSVTSEGYFHCHYRDSLRNQFSRSRLNDYAQILIDSFGQHSSGWQQKGVIEFSQSISDVTLDVVSKGIVGVEFTEAEKKQVRTTIDQIYNLQTRYLELGPAVTSWLSPLAFGHRRMTAKTRQLFDEKTVEASRCPFAKGYIFDFLQKEVGTKNPAIDIGRKKLVDELLGLIVAGIDTVSIATSWAVRILLDHPEIVEKIRAEADAMLATSLTATIGHEQLPYTRSVLLETLRLYPPFPLIVKQSVDKMIISDRVIPAKSPLFFLAFSIQRDQRWFADPLAFRPERWNGRLSEINQSTFLPFGTGTHRCLGWELALLEGCLILALLYSRFHVESASPTKVYPTHKIPYTMKINLTPKGGVRVRLRPRSN
jgi:cytochrome P450